MQTQIEYLKTMEPNTQFRVKNPFWGGGTLRAKKYEDCFFIYGKGRRHYGWQYQTAEDVLAHGYTPIVEKPADKTEEWHRRIRRALKEIDRTGLWKGSTLETQLRNSLLMTYEDRKAMYDLYWKGFWEDGKHIQPPELLAYKEKYPFAFYEDSVNTGYLFEVSECALKPVYFGKWRTERERSEIAKAIELGCDYSNDRIRDNYDYSFEMRMCEDGIRRAWYSQEYKDCGNGHYFAALSEKTALFLEND